MSGYNFEAMSKFVAFGGYGDWYWLSSEERERALNERLALPSYSEEALAARNRNLERREKRATQNKRRATSHDPIQAS